MENGFHNNPYNWKIEYTIEYVDNLKVWDDICNEKYQNPWEAYSVRKYDNASEAMHRYALMVMKDNVYDCKLFAHYETENGEWYEEYIDFESTFYWDMRGMVDRNMRKRLDETERTNTELEKQNKNMMEFIRKLGFNPYDVI